MELKKINVNYFIGLFILCFILLIIFFIFPRTKSMYDVNTKARVEITN